MPTVKEQLEEKALARQREQEEAEKAAQDKARAEQAEKERLAKVEADRLRQEAEEERAEQEAAKARLLERSGAPAVDTTAQDQEILLETVAPAELPITARYRTFQHLYANANTILPDGQKIVFGGANGSQGTYVTNKPHEIEALEKLARAGGSMVSELIKDKDGRIIPKTDYVLEESRQAALQESRENTARDMDPNVANARNNLGRAIAGS